MPSSPPSSLLALSLGTAHRPPALSPSRSPASGPFILSRHSHARFSTAILTPIPHYAPVAPASLPSICSANVAAAVAIRLDGHECARPLLWCRCLLSPPPPSRLLPPTPPRASHPHHPAWPPAHPITSRKTSQYPLFMISARYRLATDVSEPVLSPSSLPARAATGHAALFPLAASAP